MSRSKSPTLAWVCSRLDANDYDEVRELVVEAGRMYVPQKMTAGCAG
jgi:hypothetical protein